MPPLSSYTPTGRQQLGPASDLLEMQDARGEIFTAIRFHPEYRSHNAINSALFVVLSFLESPMVSGLSDLVAYDLEGSTFLYATGKSWSIAEIVQLLGDQGQAAGPRAAAELMAAAGNILVEAAEIGESAGVYSHGGLTPWRVVTSAAGKVQIIGHALPQVEILALQQDPSRMPGADAFRYCPPERLDGRKENFSSDLFGLALAVFELVTGKPLYNGLVDEIRQQAARAETGMRLQQAAEVVPEPLRALLRQALRPTIPDRFRSGGDFQAAMDAVLRAPLPGPSLKEIMQRASRIQPRARQELQAQSTQQFNRDKLKAFLAEAGVDPQELQSPARRTAEPLRPPEPARPAEPPPSNRVTPLEPPRVDPAVAALSASGMRRAGPPPDRRSLPPEGREAESLSSLPPPRTPPSRATEVRPPDPSASSASLRAGPPPVRAAEPVRAPEPPRPPDAGPPRGARPNPRQSMSLGPGSSLSGAPLAEPPAEAPRPPEPPRLPEPTRPPEPLRPPVGVARTPPSRQSLERPPTPPAEPVARAPEAPARPPEAPARPPAPSLTPAEPPPRAPGLPPPPPVGSAGGGLADLLSMVQPATRPAAPTGPATPPPPPPLGGLRTLSPEGGAARTVAPLAPPRPPGVGAPPNTPPVATTVPTSVPTPPPYTPPPAYTPPAPPAPVVAAAPPVRAPAVAPPPPPADSATPLAFSSSLADPPAPPAPPSPVTPASPISAAPATAPRPATPATPISAPPATAPRPATPAPSAPRTPMEEPEVTAPEAKVDGDQTRVIPLRAATIPPRPGPAVTAPPPTPPAPAPVATAPVVAAPVATTPVVTAPPAPALPVAPAGTPPTVPPTANVPAPRLGRHRVADNPRPTTGGNVGTYKISRAPGMPTQQFRLPTGATLAEAAATLIGRMIPARVGLDGRLLGWYRLGGSNGPLPADLKLESVSPDEVLYLHFVPGRSIWASVETAEGLRLRTPVHTAVPMSWLVDGAAELLDLPAGDWQVFLDGVMLGPHHILEDRNPGAEPRLVLRRT